MECWHEPARKSHFLGTNPSGCFWRSNPYETVTLILQVNQSKLLCVLNKFSEHSIFFPLLWQFVMPRINKVNVFLYKKPTLIVYNLLPMVFYLTGLSTNTRFVIQTLSLMLVFRFKTLVSVIYIIQKKSCSLSTKINWNFEDMVQNRPVVINNVTIFTIYDSSL